MPADKDVLQILKQDHDKVRTLLKELEEGPGSRAKDVLRKLRQEIEVHTDVEEHVVYPAYRDCVGSQEAKVMVEESRAEHMLADILLKQLADLRAGTVEFQGKASVFRETVEHHAREEEKTMFPAMRKHCHKEDLLDLGRQVQARKQGGTAVEQREGQKTRQELYEEAARRDIQGRSSMSKRQLEQALRSS